MTRDADGPARRGDGGPAAYAAIPAGARIGPAWLQPAVFVLLLVIPFVLTFLIGLVIAVIHGVSGGTVDPDMAKDWRLAFAVTALFEAVLIATVLVWIRKVERRPLATAGLGGRVGPKEAIWLVYGIGWALAVSVGLSVLPGGEPLSLPAVSADGLGLFAVVLLVLAVLAFTEELLFRGWMVSVIGARAGVWTALMLPALLFAVAHVQPWDMVSSLPKAVSFIGYVAMAAGLSALALHAGQIWRATAFHIGYNGFLALGLLGEGATPSSLWDAVAAQPRGLNDLLEAGVWCAGNVLVAGGLVSMWRRKRSAKADI